MKRLRIELARKPYDDFFGDRVAARLVRLAGFEVLEVARRGAIYGAELLRVRGMSERICSGGELAPGGGPPSPGDGGPAAAPLRPLLR